MSWHFKSEEKYAATNIYSCCYDYWVDDWCKALFLPIMMIRSIALPVGTWSTTWQETCWCGTRTYSYHQASKTRRLGEKILVTRPGRLFVTKISHVLFVGWHGSPNMFSKMLHTSTQDFTKETARCQVKCHANPIVGATRSSTVCLYKGQPANA